MPLLHNLEKIDIFLIWQRIKEVAYGISIYRFVLLPTFILAITISLVGEQVLEFSENSLSSTLAINISSIFIWMLFSIFLTYIQNLQYKKIKYNNIYFFKTILIVIFTSTYLIYIFSNRNIIAGASVFALQICMIIIFSVTNIENYPKFVQKFIKIFSSTNKKIQKLEIKYFVSFTFIFILLLFLLGYTSILSNGNSLSFLICFAVLTTILFFFVSQIGDRENYRLPTISILLLYLVASSIYITVSPIKSNSSEGPHVGLPLKEFLTIQAKNNQNAPLVVVATSGGGIRAAVWTYAVLEQIHNRRSNFLHQVVAISSVSGGTLGAATWLTANKAKENDCAFDAKAFFTTDFLSDVLRGFLFIEFLDKIFLGKSTHILNIFGKLIGQEEYFQLVNRGDTLKQRWESAFDSALTAKNDDTSTCPRLSNKFSSLWYDGGIRNSLPTLLANGTDVQSGRRIITSPDQIEGISQDSYDLIKESGSDIFLGDAILNSARFSYVSPTGKLVKDGKTIFRVVDGGYFDNYGATTAQEVVKYLTGINTSGIEIFIVQITNDSRDKTEIWEGNDKCKFNFSYPELKPDKAWFEAFAPLVAFWNTRGSNGKLTAKQLACAAANNSNVRYFHIPLKTMDGYDPPLGWTLSSDHVKQIFSAAEKDHEIDRLIQELHNLN